MIQYNKITKFALLFIAVGIVAGCTKLNEKLNSTLTNAQVVCILWNVQDVSYC